MLKLKTNHLKQGKFVRDTLSLSLVYTLFLGTFILIMCNTNDQTSAEAF